MDDVSASHNPRVSRIALGACVLALAICVGCATTVANQRWHRALDEADRDYDHGRFERARDAYLALQPKAPSELYRYMQWRLALIRAHTGEPERALAELEALERAPNPLDDEWSSRALFSRAEVMEDAFDDPQRALELYVDTVVRFPETAAAKHSFEIVLATFARRDDPWAAVVWLAAVYPHVQRSALGDNVVYTMARLFHEQGEWETAQTIYGALLDLYPVSPLGDDTRWHLAAIAQARGDVDAALALLDGIAREYDTSWSFGEYDSRLRDDAMLRRAELLAEQGQVELAIAEYDRLLAAFPTYLGGAGVAWERAELTRVALADRARYEQALRELIADFPESVPAERARFRLRLLEQGVALGQLDQHRRPRSDAWRSPVADPPTAAPPDSPPSTSP